MIVRSVGDELVVYVRQSRKAVALDATTALVWNQLDRVATTTEISTRTGLSVQAVQQVLLRLSDAGLIASGLERRQFVRLASAGLGAGALLAITAPAAVAAGSSPALTMSSTCDVVDNDSRRVSGVITGTGLPANSNISIAFQLDFTGPNPPAQQIVTLSYVTDAQGSLNPQPGVWSFPSDQAYVGQPYQVTSTYTLPESGTVVAQTTGACSP